MFTWFKCQVYLSTWWSTSINVDENMDIQKVVQTPTKTPVSGLEFLPVKTKHLLNYFVLVFEWRLFFFLMPQNETGRFVIVSCFSLYIFTTASGITFCFVLAIRIRVLAAHSFNLYFAKDLWYWTYSIYLSSIFTFY